jgi:hypothetical protein
MRTKLPFLVLGAGLALGACTDPYGYPNPGGTALLGAGLGAAAGLAIAESSRPRYDNRYYYNQGYYAPAPSYGYYNRPYYRGW